MIFSNEDLVSIADDAESEIINAIAELDGVDKYNEVVAILNEALSTLKEESKYYKEKYAEECEREHEYEKIEYERSVL